MHIFTNFLSKFKTLFRKKQQLSPIKEDDNSHVINEAHRVIDLTNNHAAQASRGLSPAPEKQHSNTQQRGDQSSKSMSNSQEKTDAFANKSAMEPSNSGTNNLCSKQDSHKDNNLQANQDRISIKDVTKDIVNIPSQSTPRLENRDHNITSEQEIRLEEEYKHLKLNLTSLEGLSSVNTFKPSTKSTRGVFGTFLFRWIFNIKLIIILVILCAGFLVYILWSLPDYKVLEQYQPKTITRVYSSDGFIISELGIQNRSVTNIHNIPQIVKDAFISAEDKTFYTNHGFDFKGIARAVVNNFLRLFDDSRSLMGASTITQQVVKNLLLNQDRTLTRKIKEAILTIKLEHSMSKDSILELYLNEIYLGMGSYGVTTAALNYFNKSLNALTLPEVAFLAMLPRSPNSFNPTTNYSGAKSRRDIVINRMLDDGKITKEAAIEAINTPIVLHKRVDLAIDYSSYAAEEVRKWVFNIIPSNVVYSEGLFIKTTINNELQKYAYTSLRKGIERVDNLKGYRGPVNNIYKINQDILPEVEITNNFKDSEQSIWLYALNHYTSSKNSMKELDGWRLAVVINVEKNVVLAGLASGEEITLDIKNNTWAFPNQDVYQIKHPSHKLDNFNTILNKGDIIFVHQDLENANEIWQLKQIPKVNGAMVVMNPINGHILALHGGFSYKLSQFNRATQALRQPGSAFKSFVYLAALEQGMKLSSLVLDAPYTSIDNNKIWRPKNNTSKYAGYVTMRNALEFSRNLASIRIAQYAGLHNISNVAKRLGIYTSDIDNFAEVIGAKETTLLRMVKAYSIIANGGKHIEPVLVNKIANRNGDIIFKSNNTEDTSYSNIPWTNQPVPPLIDNRETVIDPRNAYLITSLLEGVVSNGIGWRAKVPGYDIAGKTGTTNDSKDLWFFGFTPQVVVGIYIGEDTPTSLEPAMASTMVIPIFKDFAVQALPLLFDKIPFRIPEGIEMRWVDRKTGKPVQENNPNKILESFRSDNMETEDEVSSINDLTGEGNSEYEIY